MASPKFEDIVVSGVAYWAYLDHTNELSGKYQIDIGQLDDATVAKLAAVGIKAKNKPDKEGKNERGNFITPKSNKPPMVVDRSKQPIVDPSAIGNGSQVMAVVRPFLGKNVANMGLGLQVLQVVSLVAPPSKALDMLPDMGD